MDASDNEFIDDALRFKLLTKPQAEEIRASCTESQLARDVAVTRGYLNARKLDVLAALRDPEQVAPGYRIESVIGYGGFGVVYKARQHNLDRTVALKIIPLAQLNDDSAQKRFEREARIVGKLRHPHIVSAIDFGLHNERLFLAMEYVLGIDADRYIERKGKLSEELCWNIVRQVAMALAFAEEQDVIHRDIKPGNMMLTEPPVGYQLSTGVPMVKVADFGLACFNENHNRDDRITAGDTAVGTPYYVSPEQLLGQDVDQRADIYSLGATAWHFLAGQPPMADEQSMKIIAAKMTGDSGWLLGMPQEWSSGTKRLMNAMCAHHPGNRISSHLELIEAIDRLLASNLSPTQVAETRSAGPADLDVEQEQQVSDAERLAETPADMNTRELSKEDLPVDPHARTSDSLHREPHSGDAGSSKQVRIAVISVLLVLVLASVITVIAIQQLGDGIDGGQLNRNRNSPTRTEIELTEFAGPPIFLFNGQSIDPRQRSTGKWEVSTDHEGARVLAGRGTRNFKCLSKTAKPLRHFQFSLGFMHHQSKTISFRVKTEKRDVGKLLISRKFSKLFDSKVHPKLDHTDVYYEFNDGTPGYHNVKIRRQVGYLDFMVDGIIIGKIRNDDDTPFTIELQVAGDGSAHFEQIELREFSAGE